ncbi:hypothetical protein HII31_02299 [Pseudocercospora fuligena]|uniref:Uncharacterized protein n=1 Tax=Pseudocercospora fuligena TaxID=685502 RepID=A0A8H6RS09_9PEZI|nr:hypothetical protein HII31_02299 [Pseudocercospora fuligena]
MSSYAPKHTSKPAHSHQGAPKYPSSTVSRHHSPSRWTIPGLPPKWSTIFKPSSSRHYNTPKYTSSSSASYSHNTAKYSTSKPAHSYRYNPPKHTESPSYPQVTPKYTSSMATYPHSTPKYTTSSARHPHHNTYPSPPRSSIVDPCDWPGVDCSGDNLPLPFWCDDLECHPISSSRLHPGHHPKTSTKKHVPSYPTVTSPHVPSYPTVTSHPKATHSRT